MILFILLFLTTAIQASIGSELAYSRACVDCQKGDWKAAQATMSSLVVDQPDNPELLYDNGVVAYRLHEFQKARAYFDQVIKDASVPLALKKNAHFNLGNTQVGLGEYAEAIQQYEAVLDIDKNDMMAQHNLNKVKQLLEEKQQEEQKQNQDQQSHNGDQENKSDQQKQSDDRSQEGAGKKDDQENNRGSQSGEQSDRSSGEHEEQGADQQEKGEQKQQTDGESAGDNNQEEQDEFGREHNSSSQKSDESPEESSGNSTASHHTKDEPKEQDQKEGARAQEAGSGDSDDEDDTDLDNDRRAQEQKDLKQKLAPNEQWMAHVLQRREKADEHASKQLIKQTVNKNMAGRYGQNNW